MVLRVASPRIRRYFVCAMSGLDLLSLPVRGSEMDTHVMDMNVVKYFHVCLMCWWSTHGLDSMDENVCKFSRETFTRTYHLNHKHYGSDSCGATPTRPLLLLRDFVIFFAYFPVVLWYCAWLLRGSDATFFVLLADWICCRCRCVVRSKCNLDLSGSAMNIWTHM